MQALFSQKQRIIFFLCFTFQNESVILNLYQVKGLIGQTKGAIMIKLDKRETFYNFFDRVLNQEKNNENRFFKFNAVRMIKNCDVLIQGHPYTIKNFKIFGGLGESISNAFLNSLIKGNPFIEITTKRSGYATNQRY